MNIEMLKKKYGSNKPIYLKKISEESGLSYNYIKKFLSQETKKGNLERFADGIYYFSDNNEFKNKTIDSNIVVEEKYIKRNDDIYGYYSGLTLLQEVGITNQIPAIRKIITNNESTRSRKVKIGSIRVQLSKSRIRITKENVDALRLLEIMNSLDSKEISKYKLLIDAFIKKNCINKKELLYCLQFFPKKAIVNLIISGILK